MAQASSPTHTKSCVIITISFKLFAGSDCITIHTYLSELAGDNVQASLLLFPAAIAKCIPYKKEIEINYYQKNN